MMMREITAAVVALSVATWSGQALAQRSDIFTQLANGTWAPASPTNPVPVSGTFSATIAGFTPGSTYATLSVSGVSSNVALPAGTVVLVQNTGANTAFVNLGTSNAVVATTSQLAISAGAGCALTVGSNTFIAGITSTSTTTLNLAGGSGLGASCYGGGSSGSGGGGGTSSTDEAAFTFGTTALTLGGGVFQTTATNNALTNAQSGAFQVTAQRALFTNLRNASGTEIGNTTTPLIVGGPAASGSAVVGNPVRIGGETGAGNVGEASTSTWGTNLSGLTVLGANVDILQGNALLSTTNGLYSNLLQGNAVLSTSNPIFITGTGTAGTAASNPITVQGIASMTPVQVSQATAGNLNATVTINQGGSALSTTNGIYGNILQGNAVLSATNGLFGNLLQGNAVLSATNPIFSSITDGTNKMAVKAASTAPAATDPAGVITVSPNSGTANNATIGNGSVVQGIGSSAEPTKVTTGNTAYAFSDLVGKRVTSPYSNRENQTHGYGAQAGTSAITILPASGSASLKEYLTDLTCSRSDAGTTAISVTLNDSVSRVIDIPANGGGGGWKLTFETPLVFTANTAATATPSAGVTTLHCSGDGFNGY